MLRIALYLAVEAGLQVVAPVHDAILMCFRLEDEERDIGLLRRIMDQASRIVLADDFPVRTDSAIYRHPDRYADPRGAEMWERVWRHIEAAESQRCR